MKVYNYISMLFLAGAVIVASCSQNEELTGETPDSLQGFQSLLIYSVKYFSSSTALD